MNFIDLSAKIIDSKIGDETRVFKNAWIKSSDISEKCLISDLCRVEDSEFDYSVWLYPNGMVYSTQIGRYSYAQKNSSMWHASIGKYCSISWNVSIGGAEHDFHRITSHSMLYAPSLGFVEKPLYNRFEKPCIVGNDVWIGAGAHILRDVSIGDGAVIAAGAVVTKDVAPYTIVAGIPAKEIGQRCSDRIIEQLLAVKWWDFPDKVIKDNITIFNNEFNDETVKKLLEIKESMVEI